MGKSSQFREATAAFYQFTISSFLLITFRLKILFHAKSSVLPTQTRSYTTKKNEVYLLKRCHLIHSIFLLQMKWRSWPWPSSDRA